MSNESTKELQQAHALASFLEEGDADGEQLPSELSETAALLTWSTTAGQMDELRFRAVEQRVLAAFDEQRSTTSAAPPHVEQSPPPTIIHLGRRRRAHRYLLAASALAAGLAVAFLLGGLRDRLQRQLPPPTGHLLAHQAQLAQPQHTFTDYHHQLKPYRKSVYLALSARYGVTP